MFWGCKIKDNKSVNLTSNGDCILTIKNICLKYSNKNDVICLYLKKDNNNDILLNQLNSSNKLFKKLNIVIDINKYKNYNLYIKGGKAEIHLIGCLQLKNKSDYIKNLKLYKNKDKNIELKSNNNLDDSFDSNNVDKLLKRKRSLSN